MFLIKKLRISNHWSALVLFASALTASEVSAKQSMFETAPEASFGSGTSVVPVVILHHADGSRELLAIQSVDVRPAEKHEDRGSIRYPFELRWPNGSPVTLSFVGGVEAGTLEGLAASIGVFIGDQGDGILGQVHIGWLIEVDVGTEATKAGVGYSIGSTKYAGLNLNATYIRSYGRATSITSGEDLLGIELGGEIKVVHWFVGILDSLQTGDFYVNAGAGVRFY